MITIKQGVVGNDGENKFIEPGLVKDGEGAAKMLSLKMEKCHPPFVPQAIPGYPTLLTVIRNGSVHERTFIATFEGEAAEMLPLFRQAVECLLTSERWAATEASVRRMLIVSLLEPDAKERLVERIASPRAYPPFSDEGFRTLIERKLERPHLCLADMVYEMDAMSDPEKL